ncbi:MAG: guanylate kinase [Pseudomonadota bacterium]|nr:guanylate kinase [Pseudomonadota bacterium]
MVSGPSGVGKTSLVHRLLERTGRLRLSISYTTRAPRPGERDGVDYYFISEAEFEKRIADDSLVEYAQVFGNYYGTGRDRIDETLAAGDSVLLEIDWQGAGQIRRVYPEMLSLMIVPPSIAGLEARLRGREQDDEAVIERRMREADAEMSHCAEYDYLVINHDFDDAVADLVAIVRAARLRSSCQKAAARQVMTRT